MKFFPIALSPALALLLTLHLPAVHAQSGCRSDGTGEPQALFERFISADCADCWADASTPQPGAGAAVLDWIVPSAAGDEAPLSAAARREALERLTTLQRAVPQRTDIHTASRATPLPGRLRVAIGPAVNDYVGAVVLYTGAAPAASAGAWAVSVVLTEEIPSGSEDTAVPRAVVRHMYRTEWSPTKQLEKSERINLPPNTRWIDRVALQLPAGTNPDRLSAVAWLQAGDGSLAALARSTCRQEAKAPRQR